MRREVSRTTAWIACTVVLLGSLAIGILYPRVSAKQVQSPFEAAAILERQLRQGDTGGVTFRAEQVDLDEVYEALESRYPYAFSIRSLTRANGTTDLICEVARPAQQALANEQAKTLAASLITPDMTDSQKLRALHDALVRGCKYDEVAAENPSEDGSTAPFAADGALLDGKAVCAGYGRAFSMMCQAIDIPVVYVTSEQMNHGWNAVRLAGQTYYIDCTFDDPVPDGGNYVHTTYFMKTASQLRKSHQWDEVRVEQTLDSLSAFPALP